MSYLYRGVSESLFRGCNGKLIPKKLEPFTYIFHWEEAGLKWDSGGKWDSSATNAVIRHQLNQEAFPTSGISTTPFFDRAKFYATIGGKSAGYIYKIDRSLFGTYMVKEFDVSKFARHPSVPEDQEVILVASDFGPLPDTIVVEIVPI